MTPVELEAMSPDQRAATDRLAVRAFQVLSFGCIVRCEDRGTGETLDRLLEPFRVDHLRTPGATYSLLGLPDGPSAFGLFEADRCIRRSHSPDLLLELVLWDLNRRAIASVEDRIVLHAAAASRGGRALLLPGGPDAGKTTTVAGLVRAGFDYLTDEAALIDPEALEMHPYPRPLSLSGRSERMVLGARGSGRRRGANVHVVPDDLRPRAIGRRCAVDTIVFPRYVEDAETSIERLPRAEALEGLVRAAFNLPAWGPKGFEALGELVRRAACFTLTIGDLPTAVRSIESVVRASGMPSRPR